MNLREKVMTLAIAGTMGVTALAGATNIGVVNISQVVQAYPGYGALEMQAKKVEAEYTPQIQKEMNKIQKMNDKEQQQSAYNANVVPLVEKANAAENKIFDGMLTTISNKINVIREQKKLDIVVDDPRVIVSAPQDSQVVDITNDVVNAVK